MRRHNKNIVLKAHKLFVAKKEKVTLKDRFFKCPLFDQSLFSAHISPISTHIALNDNVIREKFIYLAPFAHHYCSSSIGTFRKMEMSIRYQYQTHKIEWTNPKRIELTTVQSTHNEKKFQADLKQFRTLVISTILYVCICFLFTSSIKRQQFFVCSSSKRLCCAGTNFFFKYFCHKLETER